MICLNNVEVNKKLIICFFVKLCVFFNLKSVLGMVFEELVVGVV